MVIEVPLGRVSGDRVLQQLPAVSAAVPVAVSTRDGETDQANGLDQGAEAYLVQPLCPLLLIAHLRAVLRRRRRRGLRAEEQSVNATRTFQIGASVLTLSAGQLSLARRSVRLTGREAALLTALADPPGQVFSRSELLRSAWSDADTFPSVNSVEVYVSYLRRKLTQIGAGHLLRTVYGCGYQLGDTTPPPKDLSEEPTAPARTDYPALLVTACRGPDVKG